MFLSGSFLGIASFQNAPTLPIKKAYTKIKVFGNATIDKLQIHSTEIDNTTLQNTIITNTATWTPDTLLLAEFENTLNGGNITGIVGSVQNFQVTRTDTSSSSLKTLATISGNQSSFVDYSVQSNKQYTYDVFALSNTQISQPLQTAVVDTTPIWGYFLVDPVVGTVYKFDLNVDTTVSSDGMKTNEDVTIYDTYTQYASVAFGKKGYMSTSIKCIAGIIDVNGQLQQSASYIDSLRLFILNGQPKLWKTRKGQIFNVITHNFRHSVLNDGISTQPLLITFDIVEISSI